MKPEDIKKLPTPETDATFQMFRRPALHSTAEKMMLLEQRLAAAMNIADDFCSGQKLHKHHLETLASIRSMK